MLKTGDIIYKVTLEGYDIPCVVVKKYKVGQHLSKIDGTESGGYIYVFDKKDIPEARKQILKNKIARLQSELNYFKRRLNEENNNDEKV